MSDDVRKVKPTEFGRKRIERATGRETPLQQIGKIGSESQWPAHRCGVEGEDFHRVNCTKSHYAKHVPAKVSEIVTEAETVDEEFQQLRSATQAQTVMVNGIGQAVAREAASGNLAFSDLV